VSGRQRKLAFAGAAAVLLATTVLLTLREPGPPRQHADRQRPVGTTEIRIGPPPASGSNETSGSRATTQSGARSPSRRSSRAVATRSEREAKSAPAIAPHKARAAAAAARAFLEGYLPYSYGRAQAKRIRAAATSLLRDLEASPPRVPASVARTRPQLISVRAEAATGGSNVDVVAVVEDSQRRYRIPLAVRHAGHRWIVTAVRG
jgi:hypothetical protein